MTSGRSGWLPDALRVAPVSSAWRNIRLRRAWSMMAAASALLCRWTTLLANYPAPRLVKVDVEGSEVDVLAGASILLRECRPLWIVEAHGTVEPVTASFEFEGYEVSPMGKGVEGDSQLPVGGSAHLLAVPRS